MLRREACPPRRGWYELVKQRYGLVYIDSEDPKSNEIFSYWTEAGYYSLSRVDKENLRRAAATLQAMFVEAGDYVIEYNLFDRFGIPNWAIEAIKMTWQDDLIDKYWPSIYGRFDVGWDGKDGIKLFEYNADTPTSLPESTGVQWAWHEYNLEVGSEQWNDTYECLVMAWRRNLEVYQQRSGRKVRLVHLAYTSDDVSGEDLTNVAWMASAVRDAGYEAKIITVESIKVSGKTGEYSVLTPTATAKTGDFIDADGVPIEVIFKLFPWEWMFEDAFGKTAVWNMLHSDNPTIWVEPVYKALWSNKAILPILWKLFKDDPIRSQYLLPAYFEGEEPDGFCDGQYVRKPILGREGACTAIFIDGELVESTDGPYGKEGYILQKYFELPQFGAIEDPSGVRPVLGLWMVDNDPDGACGLGIRESGGRITNNISRFVPHKIID